MVTEVSRGDATHQRGATSIAEPEGWYPDPVGGAAHRFWDGEAWTRRVEPAGAAEEPATHWKRHPFSFFSHRWCHILAAGVVIGVGGTIAYGRVHNLAVITVTAFLFTCATTASFGIFIAGRLRLGEVVDRSPIFVVAIVGGITGFAIAYGVEQLAGYVMTETYVTGPIEETAKLVVPLALFATGRYRDPRAGLAIALASAAGFGILEATSRPIFIDLGLSSGGPGEGLSGAGPWFLGVVRPLVELTHMMLTGFIAAVAWRAWHLRGGFHLTWPVIGTALAAMALHSGFDSLQDPPGIYLVLIVVMYFAFKESARQLTPPEALHEVPPGWRPRWLHQDAEQTPSTAVLARGTGTG
ncbi:MAG: hypothetical protein JJLCMIEE_02458 [Acidimicrobiales bacterium]|nr:hypothetical protein [Acidimicrobiales bacterium]RIK04580.1 MAG: hypothetical protein DCC48_12775 [Acidobacteriota bacterium]